MRNVFRSTSALLVLGVVLGCYNSSPPDTDKSGGKSDQTASAPGVNEVVITVPGMT